MYSVNFYVIEDLLCDMDIKNLYRLFKKFLEKRTKNRNLPFATSKF